MQKGTEIPSLRRLIVLLERAARKNDAPVWKSAARYLSRASRQRPEVNVQKLGLLSSRNPGAVFLVPGKVLSIGATPSGKFNVAAWRYSRNAREKIEKSGCEALTIEELLEKNPNGTKVTIVV